MTRLKLLEIAKPILFNTEMVRAIQDGRKTVTRRPLKPHNAVKAKKCGYEQGSGLWYDDTFNEGDKDTHIKDYSVSCCWIGTKIYIQKYAPYKVGDVLYVRETWCKYSRLEDDLASPIVGTEKYYYRADGENPTPFNTFLVQRKGYDEYSDYPLWHSSIHMPKEAARIFLRVTDVRVERLQDIITDDYKTPLNINKEGLILSCCFCTHHNGECKDFIAQHSPQTLTCKLLEDYTILWNSTVKKSDLDKYGWDANPWVWVIEFERVEVTE